MHLIVYIMYYGVHTPNYMAVDIHALKSLMDPTVKRAAAHKDPTRKQYACVDIGAGILVMLA